MVETCDGLKAFAGSGTQHSGCHFIGRSVTRLRLMEIGRKCVIFPQGTFLAILVLYGTHFLKPHIRDTELRSPSGLGTSYIFSDRERNQNHRGVQNQTTYECQILSQICYTCSLCFAFNLRKTVNKRIWYNYSKISSLQLIMPQYF